MQPVNLSQYSGSEGIFNNKNSKFSYSIYLTDNNTNTTTTTTTNNNLATGPLTK